jgi:hypothetical protein
VATVLSNDERRKVGPSLLLQILAKCTPSGVGKNIHELKAVVDIRSKSNVLRHDGADVEYGFFMYAKCFSVTFGSLHVELLEI